MRIERETFENLVREHHAAVFRSARRIVRSDADAEDVTQQVFLAVLRGNEVPPAVPAEAERVLRWLASRLALTQLRAHRRRRHHEEQTAKMNPLTHDEAISHDELAAVRAAVDRLDEPQRIAIVLRYHEGMTLAAVAHAIGCAESTAHARVRAALDALRRRLHDAGFALGLLDLELRLSSSAAPIAVPFALEAQLLGMSGVTAVGLGLLKLAAVAVLAIGIGGTAIALTREKGTTPIESRTAVASVLGAMPTPSHERARVQDPVRTPVAPRPEVVPVVPAVVPQDPLANAPRARLEGLVLGDDGSPLDAVLVVAYCRELSRKAEPFEVRATTDASGRFALSVPITNQDGLDWRLRAERSDWLGTFAQEVVHVRPGELRRGLAAKLHRWAADVAGTWRADFVVTDGAGRAVPSVHVVVLRRQRGDDGGDKLTREAGATTTAEGRASLTGDHLGEKLVRLIPWGLPYARTESSLAIRVADPGPVALQLEGDVPLRVLVVDARSGAAIARHVITASRGGDSHAVGVTEANGQVELRGLDGGPVELSGGGGEWSRFALADDLPPTGTVTLRLKRADDPDSIGLHGPELHGRVVDAVTREPLVVPYGSVHTWWLPEDSTAVRESILRDAITPAPYQTAMMHEPPPPSSSFQVPVQRPGRYALVARVDGYAVAAAGPFDVPTNGIVKDIEIALERGTRLLIDVRDPAGRAVEDAQVWIAAPGDAADAGRALRAEELARAADSGQRAPAGRGLGTDATGRAIIERVPSGIELSVQAAHRSRAHGAGTPFRLDGTEAERVIVVVVAPR